MHARGLNRNPEFLKLWAGQAISQVGSQVSRSAVPLTALLVLHASPLQMGMLSGASGAIVLVFGLIAGAWVDRLQRRPILIGLDLARMALLGTIPLAAVAHRLTMAHLYVAAALLGILEPLFEMAYQAYLPSLIEPGEVVEGNSKVALTESVSEVIGPGLTGVLVKLLTAPIAIAFDALSFLCSAVSLALIRKPELRPESRPDAHIGREIAEGLRACWNNALLRALAARTGTVAFFSGFFGALYFVFVIGELRIDVATAGFIISVGGASSVLGAWTAKGLVDRYGFGPTFIGSALVSGVAGLAVPLAHGPAAVCCVFLLISQLGDLAWPILNINESSLRQAITPSRLLGRVNSATHLLYRGGLPLGSLAGGALAQVIGVRSTLFLASAGILLSTLWLVLSPVARLRSIPAAHASNV